MTHQLSIRCLKQTLIQSFNGLGSAPNDRNCHKIMSSNLSVEEQVVPMSATATGKMRVLQLVKAPSAAKDAFKLVEMPSFVDCKDNEVVIKVEAFGLNFADVLARKGLYRDCPPLPCVIGYEVCGRITMRGASVTALQVGDRVAAFTRFGGYGIAARAK